MKRTLAALIIVALSFTLLAKPQEITSFKASVWLNYIRDLMEIDVHMMLDKTNNEIYFQFDIPASPLQIIIDEEYRKELLDYINKFQRKVRMADMREETYDLELGKFPTARSRFFKFKTWHDSKFNSTANFFSQKAEQHQFLIMLSPMNSQPGGKIKREGTTFYFEASETKKLEKYLSKNKFDSFLQ